MGTDMSQAMQERKDGDQFFHGKRRLPRFRNCENVKVYAASTVTFNLSLP